MRRWSPVYSDGGPDNVQAASKSATVGNVEWGGHGAHSLKQADAGADAAPWMDERTLFLGERNRGHALISPELEERVANELAKESAILKERRYAREEKLLRQAEMDNIAGPSACDQPRPRGRGRGR